MTAGKEHVGAEASGFCRIAVHSIALLLATSAVLKVQHVAASPGGADFNLLDPGLR